MLGFDALRGGRRRPWRSEKDNEKNSKNNKQEDVRAKLIGEGTIFE